MAFDVRCPSCKAKMRFDDPPKRGDPIVCPKCNTTFPAPSANAFEEKKADEPKKADTSEKAKKKPKTVEAEPRTYFNHWLLLLIVGGLMGMLITVLTVVWVVVARAAKAEDMVACVPDNFNVIRGVNVKAMRNYPGMKANMDKVYDADAQGIIDECSKKLGIDKDVEVVYYVCARQANSTSVLHLFATRSNFDPSLLGNGQTVPLGRAGHSAVCPTRNVIIVGTGSNASNYLSVAAENARSKPRDGMHTKLGTTGRMAIRGQIWTIFRDTGTLQGWMARGVEPLKDGPVAKLREAVGKASVLATWVSFGTSGVRVGAGIEVADSKDASDLVVDLKKGPLGKADESEAPHTLKQALPTVANVSQNGAFWQYLEYKQSGSCAYLTSKIEDPEKYAQLINEFINSTRGAGGSTGGFGGFR